MRARLFCDPGASASQKAGAPEVAHQARAAKELVRTPGSVVSHRSLRIPDEASHRPVRVQVTVRTAAGVGGSHVFCFSWVGGKTNETSTRSTGIGGGASCWRGGWFPRCQLESSTCRDPRSTNARDRTPALDALVLFLDRSRPEGQPPMAGAAAVRVKGVGQVTESVVEKMVYGAASHGEVQAVADVIGEIGEDIREVWMVVDAEADMASLRRLASRPLHGALGTGLSSRGYAIWHGLEMKKVPLVIHMVKQESHRAGVGNHEADGAAQAVDKEQEPEWRVPERKEHLHLVHIPPRVGEEEKARWVVEEDRGKQDLRVYPQPVHMVAQVRGGPEVVELNEYLEGKVGQRVHYPNVLRPESLPTRRLQAITGQVPVRETIMRWYRHKGMDLPEEYMRCHCGQGQETYEHFMRCAQYKEIEEPLTRAQDVPLLKKGARGRSAVERELGKEGHCKGLWHMVIVKPLWRAHHEHTVAPEAMAHRLLRRMVEHLLERMACRETQLEARADDMRDPLTKRVEMALIRYNPKITEMEVRRRPDWRPRRSGGETGMEDREGDEQRDRLMACRGKRIRRI